MSEGGDEWDLLSAEREDRSLFRHTIWGGGRRGRGIQLNTENCASL